MSGWLKLAMFAAVAAWGQAAFAQGIHLKSREVSGSQLQGPRRGPMAPRLPGPVHQIVQFDHPPGVQDVEALMAAGYQVVAAVPDNAVVVSAPDRIARRFAGVKWIGELETGDRLSPALADGENIEAVVEFHPDVGAGARQSVAAAEGVALLQSPLLLANHALIRTSADRLRALAEHDEVAYIFPADPGLLTGERLMPCVGLLTLAGPIGQYANIVHGWDLDSDKKAHLGYFFGALTAKLPALTVQSEILRAFETWASVAGVVFTPALQATAARAIAVEFAGGGHGDAFPFDGAGQTLAHTFYPIPLNSESMAGDIHLNAAVNWRAGSDTDVYTVTLHEIGHALGLGHSDKPGDVMYPYYRRGMPLSANDIGAVQSLYGAPGSPSPGPPVISTSAPSPLSLSLNPLASPTAAAQVPLSGTVSGGTPPLAIGWQTDRGLTGSGVIGKAGAWTVAGISLSNGPNAVTVTAFDSSKNVASQSAMVTRAAGAPPAPSRPVVVTITSPPSAVFTTSSATISLSGTASGGCGVTRVTWQTSAGATGTAVGTGPWVAPNIPLLTGTNAITVRAFDDDGGTAWAALVVVKS